MLFGLTRIKQAFHLNLSDCGAGNTLLLLLFLVMLSSPGSAKAKGGYRQIKVAAHPGYVSEFCLQGLEAEQRVFVQSQAPYALQFNIHHHTSGGTEYPIKQEIPQGFTGEFVVYFAGEYCFMWRNAVQRSGSFTIDFSYEIQ